MRKAFTLVEIMIAMAIFTVVITLVLVSMTQSFRSFQQGEQFADSIQKQRLCLVTMGRNINSLVKIDPQKCPSFKAEGGAFSFIFAQGAGLIEARFECNTMEQALNRYYQSPADYDYLTFGEKQACLKGLVECRFSYGDGQTWKSNWDQGTEGIPRMVRLEFRGKDDPETREFLAHIPVSR